MSSSSTTVTTPTQWAPGRAQPGRLRSRRSSRSSTTRGVSRSREPTSMGGPIIRPSSSTASRRVDCSPEPKASRPQAEVALWGGTAGQQYDPCYHAACDTFDNVNEVALDTNSDAIAYVTLSYAMSTEEINGVPGQGQLQGPATRRGGDAGRRVRRNSAERERAPIGALSRTAQRVSRCTVC